MAIFPSLPSSCQPSIQFPWTVLLFVQYHFESVLLFLYTMVYVSRNDEFLRLMLPAL